MIAAAPLAIGALSSLLGPARTATASSAISGVTFSGASPSGATISGASGAADSFSSMLASFSQNTVDTLKTSESTSIAGIQGKATTQSVVEAVMNAQEQLQTALAVRDKAVSAFQDISRMPI